MECIDIECFFLAVKKCLKVTKNNEAILNFLFQVKIISFESLNISFQAFLRVQVNVSFKKNGCIFILILFDFFLIFENFYKSQIFF